MQPPRRARRVAIIGGGITGLAAAHALEMASRAGHADVDYALFEASATLGGNVRTERVDDFVIDEGPDGFVVTKPHAAELCRAVGLADQLIETKPANRRVYVVRGRQLVQLPEGMMLAAPTRIGPIARTSLISWPGKLRMALDLVLPRRIDARDESMSAFIERRLGREAAEFFGEPIMAGIFAGDPDTLSIRATFPQLVAMEAQHGGLIRGAIAARRQRTANRDPALPPPSPFLSLTGGMGGLVGAVAAQLRTGSVHNSAAVRALRREASNDTTGGTRWRVEFADREAFSADDVVLAVPPRVSAGLLEPHDSESTALLREIPHMSTATAVFAFLESDVPRALDASGFLVPRSESLRMTASTWISSKWPGRAPDGKVLMRVFFGGARDPEITECSDGELLTIARDELSLVMGIHARPLLERVYRYRAANPQMILGHPARMSRLRTRMARLGGIDVAGGGYDGVGIPDCVKQGQAAAKRILPPRGATS